MLKKLILVTGVVLAMTTASLASEVKEYKLDNGLMVLLKENHNAPVINFNVAYRVGSKYERPGITGISHLLEHMMFKTTKNLALGEFDRLIKAAGADNNAYTWLDQTVYYETIAADKIDVALGVEAERMRNLLCLQEDHDLEMPVVRNELEQRNDSPFTLLYEELVSNAFRAHPYQVPTIGWIDDVEHITGDDIKAHYDRFYQPDNAFIVATGDFDSDELFAQIKKHFGHIPSGNVELPRITKEPEQLGERRFEIRRAGQMDFFMAGWHIPESEHEDAYALEVLGNILGQGRTSRLYQALVDNGKCAQAQAWSSAFGYADPFLFFVSGVMNPGVEPDDVEPTYYEEIGKIIDNGVTEMELARAKKQARVEFVYERDSIVSEARSLIDFELMSSWKNLDKYLSGVEAVTSDDLKRVAGKYLTKDNRTVGVYRAIRPEQPLMGDGGIGDEEFDASTMMPGYRPGSRWANAAMGGASINAISMDEDGFANVVELENGITVIVKENHSNPTVNISGLVRAGKIDDPADKPGVGSFAISMLSSGTYEHSKLELAEIMENSGIELGFSPSRETFSFGGRSLTEDLDILLDMLAEQLLWPSFPEAEVEKTRQQILSGLLNGMNDTFEVGFYGGRDLIYGTDNPFAGRVEGTQESVKAITREDLANWHEAHSNPEGAIITIVGDVDSDAVVEAIRTRFANWGNTENHRNGVLASGAEFGKIGGVKHNLAIPDKSNATVLFMGPGPSKLIEDWPDLMVANFIFGGDFYSRINERLRVKEGLTYGSFSWFSNGLAAGPFTVGIQVNPGNIEPAIEAATEELVKISSEGISAEELAKAKQYLTGNFPVKLSTNGAVAGALTDAVYLGRGVNYILAYQDVIESVSLEGVNNMAAKYMNPENLALIVSGSLIAE